MKPEDVTYCRNKECPNKKSMKETPFFWSVNILSPWHEDKGVAEHKCMECGYKVTVKKGDK